MELTIKRFCPAAAIIMLKEHEKRIQRADFKAFLPFWGISWRDLSAQGQQDINTKRAWKSENQFQKRAFSQNYHKKKMDQREPNLI